MNARRLTLSAIITALLVCVAVAPAQSQTDRTSRSFTDLRERAVRDGEVRVLVEVGARERFLREPSRVDDRQHVRDWLYAHADRGELSWAGN